MEKLQTFDLSFFIGKNYFSYDESQNYLIFKPVYNTFIRLTGTETIIAWKSKGLSTENIKTLTAPDNSIAPELSKIAVKFNGGCLKQNKATFTHKNVMNLFIVYELYTL